MINTPGNNTKTSPINTRSLFLKSTYPDEIKSITNNMQDNIEDEQWYIRH